MRLSITLLAGTALAVAGCGDSHDSTADEATPATQASGTPTEVIEVDYQSEIPGASLESWVGLADEVVVARISKENTEPAGALGEDERATTQNSYEIEIVRVLWTNGLVNTASGDTAEIYGFGRLHKDDLPPEGLPFAPYLEPEGVYVLALAHYLDGHYGMLTDESAIAIDDDGVMESSPTLADDSSITVPGYEPVLAETDGEPLRTVDDLEALLDTANPPVELHSKHQTAEDRYHALLKQFPLSPHD